MIANVSPVSSEIIKQLIKITEPYYAIHNPGVGPDGTITCTIPLQQHLFFEPLPVSFSEAGRHLSVLAAGICALHNPDKIPHYYLPDNVSTIRKDFNFYPGCITHLSGSARYLGIKNRIARTSAFLKYENGDIIGEYAITFRVTEHREFEQNHSEHIIELGNSTYNPYIVEPSVTSKLISSKHLFGVVEKFVLTDSRGYFSRLPVVPASSIYRVLIKCAILLMQHRLNNPEAVFCVRECTTETKNLVFPGEEIDLNARFIHTDEKGLHLVKISSFTNCDCCVGTSEVVLMEVN